MEIFLGSHHFLLIMKHTPPPLVFPASAVLSIRKTEKLSDGVAAETYPGSKIVHLIFQGLDISEQNTRKRRTVSLFLQSVTNSSSSPAVFLLTPPGIIQAAFVNLGVPKNLHWPRWIRG